jgi:hypothetical protein
MTNESGRPREHLRQWLHAIALPSLFVFGTLICLYYGRDGFMPIDQSIIYDGAWRVLCGQVPLRDFLTPTGIVPILVQTAFLQLFGVNWFAYCLHAAAFNGLFAMLSAVVMYVPSGTPLMEQDAFLFMLLACVACGASARAGRRAPLRWFAAGLCLVIAVLC